MPSAVLAPTTIRCAGCDAQLATSLCVCPGCGRLVHAVAMNRLSQTARDATAAGDVAAALSALREALDLLPADSRQHQIIAAKITELGRKAPAEAATSSNTKSPASRFAGAAAALGLLLWKLKFLLFGLGKVSTLLTMLLSLGVYWAVFGWPFALGLVLSIYVHEMGHVIALRRYGFRATAPMFIPGLGAVIRLQQQVVNPDEDADIGLAGPVYGLAAAMVVAGFYFLTHKPILAAIAGVGAWINLFNLLPIGTLDGGRGFHALSRPQRLIVALAAGGCWACTHDGVLLILTILTALRGVAGPQRPAGNWKATAVFCGLVMALSILTLLRTHA